MRWQGRQGSSNIEDRRGRGSGGGFSRMPRRGRKIGLGTIVILLIAWALGGDPIALLQQMGGGAQAPVTTQRTQQPNNSTEAQFVSVVLKETETIFHRLFQEQVGKPYREPGLVLYDGQVRSACGFASSATGPFYCPGDRKIYIDLSFYSELKNRFGAPGDFAMAYVVAHEVGHHIQYLLGTSDWMNQQRRRLPKVQYNQLSVRLELQADFYAGVWARYIQQKGLLEEGDIQEALRAANAIGDDRLQKQAQGYVVPESFTHGTSEQRMRWFRKGFESGDLRQGDTFNARAL